MSVDFDSFKRSLVNSLVTCQQNTGKNPHTFNVFNVLVSLSLLLS